jgi:hypothetical protein
LQISGMSLTFTRPCRLCLFRVLLGETTTVTSFPLSKHTGGGGAIPTFSSQLVYLWFTWEVSLPPISSGVFLTLPLLQAFPLLVAGWVPPLLPSPASLFIYSSMRDCPSPPLWHSGSPTLFATCLFFFFPAASLLFSLFFFPWVGVSLSWGLC